MKLLQLLPDVSFFLWTRLRQRNIHDHLFFIRTKSFSYPSANELPLLDLGWAKPWRVYCVATTSLRELFHELKITHKVLSKWEFRNSSLGKRFWSRNWFRAIGGNTVANSSLFKPGFSAINVFQVGRELSLLLKTSIMLRPRLSCFRGEWLTCSKFSTQKMIFCEVYFIVFCITWSLH